MGGELPDVKIADRSSIVGKPKAVTRFEHLGGEQFRPVDYTEHEYTFSDSLSDRSDILVDDRQVVSGSPPLGAISEVTDYESAASGTVERRNYNVFKTNTRKTQYFYDGATGQQPDQTARTRSRTFAWDALTGRALANATETSDGDVRIRSSQPAYWRYTPLRSENMLSQEALSVTRRVSSVDVTDGPVLAAYLRGEAGATPDDDVVSASVTTWSNVPDLTGETRIWRKNATYAYDTDFPYENFPWSHEAEGELDDPVAPVPDAAFPWQRTSDVTRYDRFGRPTETVARDGSYSTTRYGYDQEALVVATASKARRDETYYLDFEGGTGNPGFQGDSGTGHTGQHATKATKLGWDNVYSTRLAKGTYRVTHWARQGTAPLGMPVGLKIEKADGVVLANIRPGLDGSEWEHRSGTFTLDQEGEIILRAIADGGTGTGDPSLYHWVDQIRIHPVGARMKTFTYDPFTWEVTSITGVNGSTTFYEYDLAGRLVAVRNQHEDLTHLHEYAVADFVVKDDQIEVGETIRFDGGSSVVGSIAPGGWTYQWDFGESGLLKDGVSPLYSFASTGQKEVTLQLITASGRVAASETQSLSVVSAQPLPELSVQCEQEGLPTELRLCEVTGEGASILELDWTVLAGASSSLECGDTTTCEFPCGAEIRVTGTATDGRSTSVEGDTGICQDEPEPLPVDVICTYNDPTSQYVCSVDLSGEGALPLTYDWSSVEADLSDCGSSDGHCAMGCGVNFRVDVESGDGRTGYTSGESGTCNVLEGLDATCTNITANQYDCEATPPTNGVAPYDYDWSSRDNDWSTSCNGQSCTVPCNTRFRIEAEDSQNYIGSMNGVTPTCTGDDDDDDNDDLL